MTRFVSEAEFVVGQVVKIGYTRYRVTRRDRIGDKHYRFIYEGVAA